MLMVTLYRASGWKIAVYGREHGVAHFHIEGPDFRCSVGIATLDVIIGTVPPDILKAALYWARRNKPVLMAKWQELNG
jgi:hypothetical protein